ncbi:glycosyltransferase [Streptacidiphilus sp. PB12-B1b]|uniref:glycosyltransferase n=1 Tax=Streptacidiphilus sp. PB12-B1b TaxID=2705012 RepID=UPI0015FCA0CA|nr:glycosyltransferase [Streptacidiphilus sp. PB12-B1b]QMU75046.1 glycosyltransferase [Streptacidiphilus sp. PB12-B1b]
MKILFSSTPAFGHLLPLFPLARAFQGQGHTVGVLTAAGLAPLLEAEGFEALAAGPLPDVLFAEVARRTGADPAADPTPEGVAEFFAGTRVDLSAPEAIAAVDSWAPDLVVSELFDFVGPLAAATLGTPVATLAFGPAVPPAFLEAMRALVASRYRDRDLPAPIAVPSGRWLLDTCPPGLQFDGVRPAAEHLPLRPEPHQGAEAAASSPSTSAAARPRVLVTFGTHFADPAVVGPLLHALADLDVDLIATLGVDGKTDDYDLAPGRVDFAPFAPMAQLLEGVSAVVTHGGAGTTLGALARGIPLVILPQGADQFVQADRVAAAGAGTALPPGGNAPEAAAAALRTVLTDPAFAAAATRIGDEIAAMPSPAAVAECLIADLRG